MRDRAAGARFESERKSERLKLWAADRASQGLSAAGGRSFGYEVGNRALVPAEAEAIRNAAQRVLAGEALYSIATDWNNQGLRSVRGGTWTTTAVRRVLTAGRIAGLREHTPRSRHEKRSEVATRGVAVTEATWPAIVDRDTFEAVRAVLTSPARRRPGGAPSRTYLLTNGLAVCGLCQRALQAHPRTGGGRSYACVTGPGKGCGKIVCAADPLDDLARRMAIMVMEGEELEPREDARVGELTAALEQDRARLQRLEDALVEGDLDRASYRRRRAEVEARMGETQRRLAEAAQQGRGMVAITAEQAAEAWDGWSIGVRQGFLRLFLDQVIVGPALVRGKARFDPRRVAVITRIGERIEGRRLMTAEERFYF